jgi:hypothetical protein
MRISTPVAQTLANCQAPQPSPVTRIRTPVPQTLSNQSSPAINKTPSPIQLNNPVSSTTITSSQSPRSRSSVVGVPKNMSNLRNISHGQGVQDKLSDILAQRRLPTVDLTSSPSVSRRQKDKPLPVAQVKKPILRSTRSTNAEPTPSSSTEPAKRTDSLVRDGGQQSKKRRMRYMSSSSSASYESISTESSVVNTPVTRTKVQNSWKHLVRVCSVKLGRLSGKDISDMQANLKKNENQRRALAGSMDVSTNIKFPSLCRLARPHENFCPPAF